jgi:hypothetical protein
MPRHVPPQYGPFFKSHGASVEPSVLANRSVMIWYIDLDLHSSVVAAIAEVESARRREVRKHVDEDSILTLYELYDLGLGPEWAW